MQQTILPSPPAGAAAGAYPLPAALSGARLGDHFRLIEHRRHFDAGLVRALLCDKAPCVAYVVRGAVGAACCERFVRNFWSVIARRGSHRQGDGAVEVAQVGATQYGQASGAYAAATAARRADIEALFADLGEAGREEILRECLFAGALAGVGLGFRAARYGGEAAAPCAARSWLNAGRFCLEPHEDRAQLTLARADGFEIAEASGPLSAIVTLTGDHGGGELVVWDWAPDDAARVALGLSATGYPYPHELVERLPSIEIATSAGDFVLLRGDFVHAVRATGAPGRVSVSRFIGRVGDRVVYWT